MKSYDYWRSAWPLIVSQGLARGSRFYECVLAGGVYRRGALLTRRQLFKMVDDPAMRRNTIEVTVLRGGDAR